MSDELLKLRADVSELWTRLATERQLSDTMATRFDAALRRIEALELEMAKLTAWTRPPPGMCSVCGTAFVTPQHAQSHQCGTYDPISAPIHPDAACERGFVRVPNDANGSPLPDEGT